MKKFNISQKKELIKRMHQFNIFEKDIEESFIRSSGPGGQNINKVSSCVVLKHKPTDIQVKCQKERSQALNRYRARWMLIEKIEIGKKEKALREKQRIEKERRQKRKRPQYLKEEILIAKRQKSEKKSFRKKIRPHKLDQYL